MEKKQLALEVLAKVSGKKVEDLKPEMDLVADLSIDSPKALQLLSELEEKLKVDIEEEDASKMNTVADILSFADGTTQN